MRKRPTQLTGEHWDKIRGAKYNKLMDELSQNRKRPNPIKAVVDAGMDEWDRQWQQMHEEMD
jgi:hypothetical protein